MMQWRISVAALAGLCLLSGCQQRPEPQARETSTAAPAKPVAPALPIVEQPFDREGLLLAAMHAASDAALGRIDKEKQRTLDGKRFELRLRFGCAGDGGGDRSRGWAFDEKRRKLSLRVEPEISGDTPLVHALGEEGYEAVEGFWIRRPWMLAADCPVPPAEPSAPPSAASPGSTPADAKPGATPPSPSPSPFPHIGVAQFFSGTDARTHRRDHRAYTATKVLADGVSPSQAGYDLVISGRLRRLASGLVIACLNRDTLSPPDCIVSVQLDSVAIENPVTGESIAKWSSA
jgi:hypothetical protein